MIEDLPYRQDEFDLYDSSSFGGSFDLTLFPGNWEIRIAFVNYWTGVMASGMVDGADFPAVRGSLQLKLANETEWGEREWFAPCPNAEECSTSWVKGLPFRDCKVQSGCYDMWDVSIGVPGYCAGFVANTVNDGYTAEELCNEPWIQGLCDATCGFCVPSLSVEADTDWQKDQYFTCQTLTDPVTRQWQESVLGPDETSHPVKALFNVGELNISSRTFRETAEGAAELEEHSLTFLPPRCERRRSPF